jgi:hypothetical protein
MWGAAIHLDSLRDPGSCNKRLGCLYVANRAGETKRQRLRIEDGCSDRGVRASASKLDLRSRTKRTSSSRFCEPQLDPPVRPFEGARDEDKPPERRAHRDTRHSCRSGRLKQPVERECSTHGIEGEQRNEVPQGEWELEMKAEANPHSVPPPG